MRSTVCVSIQSTVKAKKRFKNVGRKNSDHVPGLHKESCVTPRLKEREDRKRY